MIGFGYIFKKFKTFLEINKNIQINISVLTLKFFDIVDIMVEDVIWSCNKNCILYKLKKKGV